MKKLKLLIVSQYFWPENFKINDLAFHFAELGYNVNVLTGIPNYPTGKYFDGYGIFSNDATAQYPDKAEIPSDQTDAINLYYRQKIDSFNVLGVEGKLLGFQVDHYALINNFTSNDLYAKCLGRVSDSQGTTAPMIITHIIENEIDSN